MSEPLHPQSVETLRQLIKLHGFEKIKKALDAIAREEKKK